MEKADKTIAYMKDIKKRLKNLGFDSIDIALDKLEEQKRKNEK